MGSSLLNLPGRRLLLAAQGSLQLRLYGTHLYWRSRPTVEVQTSWRQARMQHGGRRGTNFLGDKRVDCFRKMDFGELFDFAGARDRHLASSKSRASMKEESEHPLAFEVQYLPDLPPFPARPTTHISSEDVTTYIEPLVSHHWKVSRVNPGDSGSGTLSLDRRYNFNSFDDVMDFVQRVGDISRGEKHHARIVAEYSKVEISLHTHSACILGFDREGNTEFRKVPGLTRRDIRFALKVEELHEKFKKLGRAIYFELPFLPFIQRRSMKLVLQRYGPDLKPEDIWGDETEIGTGETKR